MTQEPIAPFGVERNRQIAELRGWTAINFALGEYNEPLLTGRSPVDGQIYYLSDPCGNDGDAAELQFALLTDYSVQIALQDIHQTLFFLLHPKRFGLDPQSAGVTTADRLLFEAWRDALTEAAVKALLAAQKDKPE